MSYASFIADRYLRSTRNDSFISFITSIATLGVMLGTAALIIALAVLGGFEREITDKIIGFTSHVQVLSFQNQPLRDYRRTIQTILQTFPVVKSASPFVAREALIRSRDGVDGIYLKGVDPLNDNSTVRDYVVEGNYDLDRVQGGMSKIVVGRKLARKLSLSVGDKVTVFGIGQVGEGGQARVMQFRVTGLYESGMSEYDDVYAFTDLEDAQVLFQTGRGVTGYDLMLANTDSAAAVANAITDVLHYPHYGRTVYDRYRNVFSWIQLQKEWVPIVIALIAIVATVNIVGTLLMMVLDKMKEIGVLAALGATPGGIRRIFLRQGLIIAIVGTGFGNVLAFVLCLLQLEFKFLSIPSDIYFMKSVPILLRPEYFLGVSAFSIIACIAAARAPARLASQLSPLTAIRVS